MAKCSKCRASFNDFSVLKVHKHKEHNIGEAAVCDICKKEFSNARCLKKHNCQKVRCEQCPTCHKMFYTALARDKHKAAYHAFKCKLCRKELDSQASLKAHEEREALHELNDKIAGPHQLNDKTAGPKEQARIVKAGSTEMERCDLESSLAGIRMSEETQLVEAKNVLMVTDHFTAVFHVIHTSMEHHQMSHVNPILDLCHQNQPNTFKFSEQSDVLFLSTVIEVFQVIVFLLEYSQSKASYLHLHCEVQIFIWKRLHPHALCFYGRGLNQSLYVGSV